MSFFISGWNKKRVQDVYKSTEYWSAIQAISCYYLGTIAWNLVTFSD